MLRIALIAALCWVGSRALRVDDKPGFTLCSKTPHLAQLERVDVTGCNRWPCFIIPGRSGTYTVTFVSKSDRPIMSLKSDIFAWVKLGLPSLGRREPNRIAMPGETDKPICQFTHPGCPIYPGSTTTVSKTITIPPRARLAEGPMLVELQLSDPKGRVVTCFGAPVIVG